MTQQLQEIRTTTQIAAAIESVLFVSGRPLEYAELRKLLDIDDASLASEGRPTSFLVALLEPVVGWLDLNRCAFL